MNAGHLTLITSERPATLGKTYRLSASGLEKRTAGQMMEGQYGVCEFADAESLVQILTHSDHSQAITASLPKDANKSGRLVTQAEKPNTPGALSRTKADFGFPQGGGVLILDHDPAEGAQALNRDQLWESLLSVAPDLAEAGVVWWCSGSSYIFHGEERIQGLRGQRVYVLIKDLSDTERAGDVLFKRLWLAGFGRVDVSKSGALLLRCLFDQAMFQPARLDFCGGAVCEPPLEQRRGSPVVLSSGGFLDTRIALPDLSAAEQTRYEDLVHMARVQAAPEAERVKSQWQAERLPAIVTRLEKAGVAATEARERAERTLATAQRGVLLGDFEIMLADDRVVTVGQILDDRAKYHGLLTRDPLEPGYLGQKVCGRLYLFGSSPVLTSRAHGGATYKLLRQPARLYVQKGSKAGLVDQIIERIEQEPDLFLMNGRLVRVEDGVAIPLRRHALMHTVQTRIAFFSRTDKGADSPVDLPPDVVDMLIAVLEAA